MQVIRVIEQFHDYEPTTYYIDPARLRTDNLTEGEIKKELAIGSADHEVRVHMHISDYPELKGNSEEMMMPSHARIDDEEVEPGMIANKLIWLKIVCE